LFHKPSQCEGGRAFPLILSGRNGFSAVMLPDQRFYTTIGAVFFVILGVAMSFALNIDRLQSPTATAVPALTAVAPPALPVQVD
jgi:hypothetical protein